MLNKERFLSRALTYFLLIGVALVVFGGVMGLLQVKKSFDLVAASTSGDTAKVKVLLSQGADPNSEHIEGSSALWWAVETGSLATVQILLSNGANPNSRGQYNSVIENALARLTDAEGTPEEQASKAIVRVLIASGAKTSSIKDTESLRLLKKAGARQTATAQYSVVPSRLLLGKYSVQRNIGYTRAFSRASLKFIPCKRLVRTQVLSRCH